MHESYITLSDRAYEVQGIDLRKISRSDAVKVSSSDVATASSKQEFLVGSPGVVEGLLTSDLVLLILCWPLTKLYQQQLSAD